ncbi:MarR family winged helix-turn-helix transcriptional regulator [Homoserinibacter sp. YIM 151385]|uniref:MarR family winged helix-turn-helix transcriptional regulator n=1 Tax=Homoserinibacter sp. YIM 151385 TaxID=2985506 RepID=UPI0022EFF617|nr:MarR family transcriptional regulator [Homoserinibacter sp. YIM 151385]WBU37438.1 MarR family transcriptional regulator [Homoserinibacter sp. YIM 151385]
MPAYRDDEVDLLIDRWAEILPDLDLGPLDVMSRLRRAARGLTELRAEVFGRSGLSIWEFDVLAALRREPAPHILTPTELGQRTMVGSAAISNRLEHLLERALIVREANPEDGRSRLVRLLPEGAALAEAAMRDLVEAERLALAGMPAVELAEFISGLRHLGESLPGVPTRAPRRAGG